MADPLFTGDFFIDGGYTVKQEPLTLDSNGITASMPIPTRKMMDVSNLRDYGFEFVDDSSPSTSHETGSGSTLQSPGLYQALNANSMWCVRDPEVKSETFKMDDDDIFQVDKADLIQGPTLAELNANDENFLEDLNFDDLLLPEESSYYINIGSDSSQTKSFSVPPLVHITNSGPNNNFQASSFPSAGLSLYKDSFNITSDAPSSPLDQYVLSNTKLDTATSSKHSSNSSLLLQSATSSTPPPQAVSPLQQKHSTLHELLLRKEKISEKPKMGQSVPGRSGLDIASGAISRQGRGATISRLSSSAPTHLGLDQIWQRREPRQHLLSTGSLAEAGSTSSLSTGGVLSPESHDFSHDEGFDSEDDSDHYEDFSSDDEGSMISDTDGLLSIIPKSSASANKKERYFWQYNVQAKGPKGQRLVLKTKQEDPHVLNEITDPVFSPACSVRGIKHSGKARKGDGNDLTPNPRKLASIGRELDKLSRLINEMAPVSEVPFNARPKTRKEKNKLASRACRLKKKAQHEANKLKLSGLETEHKRLNQGISQMKQLLVMKYKTETPENQEEMTKQIEKIVKSATKVKIAGHTTEFVNRILEKVKSGISVSGMEELQQ